MKEIFSIYMKKLMNKENLTKKQSSELMHELLTKDSTGERFLAYSVASQTKGETIDEFLGIFDSLSTLTKKYFNFPKRNYMDLSSSGGGKLKKINVSTLSSIIVSSPEVPVPKQSFFGITSITGSSDILEAVGLIVPHIDSNKLKLSLDKLNIGFYHHLHISSELKNLVNFGSYLQEKNLGINTPFNLVCPMYSPIKLKSRLCGTNNPNQLETIANTFKSQGYEKAWVVYGVGGIDEISVFSETIIAILDKGKVKIKTIAPKDADIEKCNYEDIAPINKESNIKDFLKIAYGLEKGSKRALILINAGAGLYISKQASSLKEGVYIAKERIESGEVGKKIDSLIQLVGYKNILDKAKNEYLK
jgi:anthranilate phosphoribosyltransferase